MTYEQVVYPVIWLYCIYILVYISIMLYKAFKVNDKKKQRTAIIKSVGYVLLACVVTLLLIAIPHF